MRALKAGQEARIVRPSPGRAARGPLLLAGLSVTALLGCAEYASMAEPRLVPVSMVELLAGAWSESRRDTVEVRAFCARLDDEPALFLHPDDHANRVRKNGIRLSLAAATTVAPPDTSAPDAVAPDASFCDSSFITVRGHYRPGHFDASWSGWIDVTEVVADTSPAAGAATVTEDDGS